MCQNNKNRLWIIRFPVISFCLLTFALTWGLKLLYAHFRIKYGMPFFNFGLVASFGPSISALIIIFAAEGTEGIVSTLRKLINWRIKTKWILISAFFEPAMFMVIVLIYWLAQFPFPESGTGFNVLTVVLYAEMFVFGLLRWGLAEEIGWRGLMLPKLQMKIPPLQASLVLAVIICLWHLNPNHLSDAFLIKEGEYLYGFFPEILERLIITIPITMVITYIFNRTRGSLLPMIIYHSASNTSYFWVKDVFGIVSTDLFRISFLSLIVIIGIVFLILLLKQQNKVKS